MKEKGIAIVVCAIMVMVVVYGVVFLISRRQQIRNERQVIATKLTAEAKKQEEERWQIQEAEADEYYHRKFALQQERNRLLRQQQKHIPKQKYTQEQWMQKCLQLGVLSNLDRTNHEVATDASTWRLMSTDSKWQMMELVHRYFDGYATIVSSISGRPLASCNAWGGIKIHD